MRQPGDDGPFLRALIVSADPSVRAALPPMLAALGVAVTIAGDPRAALALAASATPHLIFVDAGSGQYPVAELEALARAAAPTPTTSPVALISLLGDDSGARRDEHLLSGAIDCLNKPVRFAALKQAVDMAARARGEATEVTLDAAVLEQLRALEARSAGLLQRVVGAYLQASTELVARLRNGLQSADPQDVFEAAHALKSSSMNVGANRLAAIARVLESSARAGGTDYTDTLVGRVEDEHRRVCTALGNYAPRRSA